MNTIFKQKKNMSHTVKATPKGDYYFPKRRQKIHNVFFPNKVWMSAHFFYEDGQGRIVDEEGRDVMDWEETR